MIAQLKKIQFNNRYLILTVFLYVVIYWYLLHSSEYLPYVMDGNETYSSLVHAYNMYFGEWHKNYGLTDEAFSPFLDAHPVIHTHQGNWPRILAFIFFALGARSPESQIVLHVMTVGLFSIYLVHRFFSKIYNSAFAFLVCAVFMTDYILFSQWHLVTYRVWHCYFVFAVLNCMHEFDSGKKWKTFFVLNFMALFYWELVFAFFVSFWSLIYYLLITKSVRKAFISGLWIAGSGSISLSILFYQLSLFMGLKDAIKDYALTVFSRNFSVDPQQQINEIKEFYQNKNIAFFYNVPNVNQYKGFKNYFSSFFKYGFEVYTPVLSGIIVFGFFKLMFSNIKDVIVSKSKLQNNYMYVDYAESISGISWLLLLVAIFYDDSILGVGVRLSLIQSLYLWVILAPVAWCISKFTYSSLRSNIASISVLNVGIVNLYLINCSYLIRKMPSFYNKGNSILWYNVLSHNIPILVWKILTITLIFIFTKSLSTNNNQRCQKDKQFAWLTKFLIAGWIAYSLIYILSPGYLYTGYLTRYAPFYVFMLDVMVALTFYIIVREVVTLYHNSNFIITTDTLKALRFHPVVIAKMISGKIFVIICLIVPVVLVAHWIYVQSQYTKLFPADSILFIKKFRTSDYHNKSIASNTYSSPFAYESDYWGFASDNLGIGQIVLNNDNFDIKDTIYDYLWFADKNNPKYKRPDFFVCFIPNTFGVVINDLNSSTGFRHCSANRVVMSTNLDSNYKKNGLKHKLLEMAENDKWAIVKYDWNIPYVLSAN